MGKPISLFSGYTQLENRVTNYCLLILKMLYEENPKYLGEVLAALCGEDFASHVGVSFRQQERKDSSVPDGLIVQQPFTIYIETKNYDWFYDEQLENHLAALDKEVAGKKVLLALGNFESDEPDRVKRVRSICDDKYRQSMVFRAVKFEDLVGSLEVTGLPKNLSDAITDFRGFLNEENLLSSWREWLNVISCNVIPDDVTKEHVYMCPAEGGAYSHDRTRFFGMYRDKRVEAIAEIKAVVDVDLQDGASSSLKWNNTPGSPEEFKQRAKDKVSALRPTDGPTRVFLLGQLFETNFVKDSPGGMRNKRYFNIARLEASNAIDLAVKLKDRQWSEFL